jgi:hypothetical protein
MNAGDAGEVSLASVAGRRYGARMKRTRVHPWRGTLLAVLCWLIMPAAPASAVGETVLLVVEAARDTTAGFRAQNLPQQGRRALTWPHGVITVADSTAWLEHGEEGLAFRLRTDQLAGVGAGGRFGGEPGRYEIDTPLYLGDTELVACLAAGELEISPGFVIYRQPRERRDMRGDFLLLGGIILATGVLLRSARRRKRSA